MAVNFTKNKESLLQAWNEVVDDKRATDWALFGYEGQTFDLKLVNKGDGGLEEMVDDLSSGKIMYAFCRIKDPKTSLPKFVLINWQGEGAPGDRKGKCANHVRDVSSFFKGAHLTMNARTEDDVSQEVVVEMVSKATGSVYSFTDRAGPLQDHMPVGSVYRRTIPSVEIKTSERDKFWQKEEEEEKKRVAEDRRRLDEVNKKLDDDRRQREMQEASRRDKMFKEKTESINEIRAAEKKANVATATAARQKWERRAEEEDKQSRNNAGGGDRNSGENSAIQRKEELQAMISQRTINARAIFEQNTSAGQLSSIRNGAARSQPTLPLNATTNGVNGRHHGGSADNSTSSVTSPPSTDSPPSYRSPVSPDVTPPSPAPESNSASYQAPATTDSSSSTSGFSYTKNLLRESQPPRQDSEDDQEGQDWGGVLPEDEQRPGAVPAPQATVPHEREASPKVQRRAAEPEVHVAQVAQVNHYDEEEVEQYRESETGDGGPMARALYDYQAADDTEISFNPDDIIVNIDQIDEGWWQGLAPDGTYGLFPANYVELID